MSEEPDRILSGDVFAGFAQRLSVQVLGLQTEICKHEKKIGALKQSLAIVQPLLQKLSELPLVEAPKPALVPDEALVQGATEDGTD